MSSVKIRISRFLQLAFIAGAILWLSLMSDPPRIQTPFWGWDKAQHALAYGAMALTLGRFLSLWNLTAAWVWGLSFISADIYGGLLEVLQGVVDTGRSCEWNDLLADAVGAGIICIFAWLLASQSQSANFTGRR